MIGDDGFPEFLTFFLHCPFHLKDIFGLDGMLHTDAMDVPDPVEDGIGGSQRPGIFVKAFEVWGYVAHVEYGIALFPFVGVAGIVDHQRTIVHWRSLHRELMQPDCS